MFEPDRYMKFYLNENLNKYIKEVSGGINTDKLSMNAFFKNASYDISINMIDDNITLSGYKCEIITDDSQVKGVNINKIGASTNTLDGIFNKNIFLSHGLIKSGHVKFINKSNNINQTKMIDTLLSSSDDNTKYYEFNVDEFIKIPRIHGDRYIFLCWKRNGYVELFTLERIESNIIELRVPHTGQRKPLTPLQFLSGFAVYPLNEIQNLGRTDEGLLVPPISEITPLQEFDSHNIINDKT